MSLVAPENDLWSASFADDYDAYDDDDGAGSDTESRVAAMVQVDLDAAHHYTKILRHVAAPAVRQLLRRFRAEHERHVGELNAALGGMRDNPLDRHTEHRCSVLAGVSASFHAWDPAAALDGLVATERRCNALYDALLELELPPEVRALVYRADLEERAHLRALEELAEHPPGA